MGRIRVALLSCLALVLLAVVPVADAQAPEPRVVGGHTASIEQYPWQVAVVASSADFPGLNAHSRQFCGGTLVTSRIVLTAAHCLHDTDFDCDPDIGGIEVCVPDDPGGDGTKRPEPDDIDVVLGRTTLSNSSAGVELELAANSESISISEDPDFDPDTFQNDVGYLVLETPATLGASIAPIDIAGNDEAALWDDDGDLQDVSGWGSTEFSGGVDTLRAASVPIVSDADCGAPGIYGSDFDPATMVCAGFLGAGGVDTCSGDSGGPLQAPLEGGGYRLIGLTSWGFGCAEPDAPGVYTRIAEAGPGGLRDEVVTRVDQLEATFGLDDEEIVGNGGQPRTTPFAPPAPGGGGQGAGATTVSTPRANDPYLKCHKLFNKKKRRKCFRRVRASL
jgi:secreted trypsin-like serine protease